MEKSIGLKLQELQTEVSELRADVSMIKHFLGEIARTSSETSHQLGLLLALAIEQTKPHQQQPLSTADDEEEKKKKEGQQQQTTPSPPDVVTTPAINSSSDDSDDEDSDVVDEETDDEEQQPIEEAVVEPEQPAAKADGNEEEGDEANSFLTKLSALLRRLFPRNERYDPEDPRILLALSDMGFGNEERIRDAMKSSGGLVARAVDSLLQTPKPPVAAAEK